MKNVFDELIFVNIGICKNELFLTTNTILFLKEILSLQ